jgi:hypothetical protein
MQRNAARSLLISVALVIAGPAMAQSTDKEPLATSKQGNTKASSTKATAAPKRLDFVPSSNVKETAATRGTAPSSSLPTRAPAKQGSHCHLQDSDA